MIKRRKHKLGKRPPLLKNALHEIVFVLIVSFSQLLTQAGQNQVIVTTHYISATLKNPTQAEATWYMASYSLTVGTFILIAGRLGDMHGHKTIFLLGFCWFGLWSLIAGFSAFSKSQIFFDICRAFQGMGPSFILPTGLAILGNIYPPGRRKSIVFCVFAACAPNGAQLGLVFSAIFAQLVWWPWGFWVLGIVCFAFAAIAYFVIPDESEWQFLPADARTEKDDDRTEDATIRRNVNSHESNLDANPNLLDDDIHLYNASTEITHGGGTVQDQEDDDSEDELDLMPTNSKRIKKPKFDYLGGVLGVSGLVLFNFAWNQAAVVTWNVPYTYILLIIGCILLTLLAFVERHVPDPLVPPQCFSIDLCFILACIACGWGSFGLYVAYFIPFLLDFRHHTALTVSAQTSPIALSGTLAAMTTSVLFALKVPPAIMMNISMCAFFVGQTLMAFMPVSQTYWIQSFLTTIIICWGMDMSFPAGTIILSNHMPKDYQGIAASLINTIVNYSISTGLGFAGTVQYREDRNGADPLRGFRAVWYLGMGISGLGIVISIIYTIYSLPRRKKTEQSPQT